jgi:hypothetical protein
MCIVSDLPEKRAPKDRLITSSELQKVDKHYTVRKLRLIVKTVYFLATFRNSSEGDDVVELEAQGRVDIINKCFHIVILDCGAAMAGSSDDYLIKGT